MSEKSRDESVNVHFPCIHGRAKGQFVTINCFVAEELRSTIKAIGGVEDEIGKRVIDASR